MYCSGFIEIECRCVRREYVTNGKLVILCTNIAIHTQNQNKFTASLVSRGSSRAKGVTVINKAEVAVGKN